MFPTTDICCFDVFAEVEGGIEETADRGVAVGFGEVVSGGGVGWVSVLTN